VKTLYDIYQPSEPCSCNKCVSFCIRPGWWTVEEAAKAINAGMANRMMLEVSPGYSFGVLSPAFKGNECAFAYQIFAKQGCTFLKDNRCELFNTGFEPLECRYCHHDRPGLGKKCHHDIEKTWNTAIGKELVVLWTNIIGLKK